MSGWVPATVMVSVRIAQRISHLLTGISFFSALNRGHSTARERFWKAKAASVIEKRTESAGDRNFDAQAVAAPSMPRHSVILRRTGGYASTGAPDYPRRETSA